MANKVIFADWFLETNTCNRQKIMTVLKEYQELASIKLGDIPYYRARPYEILDLVDVIDDDGNIETFNEWNLVFLLPHDSSFN